MHDLFHPRVHTQGRRVIIKQFVGQIWPANLLCFGQPIVLQIYKFIANVQKLRELHLRQSGSLASLEDYRCEQTELLAPPDISRPERDVATP